MTDILQHIRTLAAELPESQRSCLDEVEAIHVQSGALRMVAPYLEQKQLHQVNLVVDQSTYEAAGQELERLISAAGISVFVTKLLSGAQGDVLADEPAIIQVILDLQQSSAAAVLAVGGGTIHDITRYAAYTVGIPFLSVPTSPSVDGFNSKGAPILVKGNKVTVSAIGPSAIFADVDILLRSPSTLVAAGFGDMLGKYTSLFDWKFGHIAASEPYLQLSADITEAALTKCVNAVDHIAGQSEEGVRILMGALIESGLAMLLFGQSHPASGSEHHLSHYWEMEFVRLGKKQLLHGAKVGVASVEISKLYHRLRKEGAWSNTGNHYAVDAHWKEIRREIERIPDPEILSGLMRAVGGPASADELPISAELLKRSLREAHKVRPGRYTLLRAYNERPSF